MKKITTLVSSCLLLVSIQSFADRPAMSERDVDNVPPPPPPPAATPMPESEPTSAVEMEMQRQSMEPQTSDETTGGESSMEVQTGDLIEIQPGQTIPVRLLDFPRRGMTMEKVQNELGRPLEISDTVGDPPITSWTYDDRIVYFERSTVLHVVARN